MHNNGGLVIKIILYKEWDLTIVILFVKCVDTRDKNIVQVSKCFEQFILMSGTRAMIAS